MRDNININSSLKLFESFRNFGGGINTQQSNEMMKDDHVTLAENVDLAWTQSIKRRYGRSSINTLPTTTNPPQGLFTFVNNAETILMLAINGKIYYARPSGTSYGSWTQIVISDGGVSGFTFQTTDAVEAVQYGDWIYFATGTKLVRAKAYIDAGTGLYTATGETVVDQYKPTSQEAMFVGTNSLNTNPAAFLVDLTTGSAGTIESLGIYCQTIQPSINVNANFTAFWKVDNTSPAVDYQWSYRKSTDTAWTVASTWTTTTTKTYAFNFPEPNTYDIRVEIRLAANHNTNDDFVLYGLEFFATPQPVPIASTNIQKCRKLVLHWDRLILYDPKPSSTYGTSDQRDCMFISDLANPLYFPAMNVISFAADTQQRVRKIVRYRNILLIFTPDTVQSLTGQNPSDYVRALINNQVGALWANSVQVVENQVFFVSKQGMYMINPNMYTQDNFNVISIDDHIKDQFAAEFITTDAVAETNLASGQVVSAVHNNQYWLYSYGSSAKLYRYFYKTRAWVTDTFSHLGTMAFVSPIVASYKGEQSLIEPAYRGGNTPVLMGEDKTVYTDLGVAYTMKLTTKYFDLSLAFNFKKLRKLFVLARIEGSDINLGVIVQADTPVILNAEQGSVSVNPVTGAVSWVINTVPNFIFNSGTSPQASLGSPIGDWILGITALGEIQLAVLESNVRAKCRRVRLTIEHSDASPCEIYGFGLQFRAKKP